MAKLSCKKERLNKLSFAYLIIRHHRHDIIINVILENSFINIVKQMDHNTDSDKTITSPKVKVEPHLFIKTCSCKTCAVQMT